MEKEILVLIRMSTKEMLITASEKYNSNNIEIFSDSTNPSDVSLGIIFIKNSIKKIEKLILAKVNDVSVVFDATYRTGIKQKIVSETISNLNNQEITKSNFDNALERVKQYYKNDNSQDDVPILFQPFQFILSDESKQYSKKYTELPLGKKANKLEILFSVTTLNKNYYNTILFMCNESNLNISQIYSSSNTSPFILENNKIIKDISITLEVEKNYSNLIITNNGVTIVTKNLKFNYNELSNKIANELKISKNLVDDLIVTEGIITKDIKRLNKVIFQKKDIYIKASQLTAILKSFIKTLIKEIDSFIKIKHDLLKNYTLNIIGKIEKIEKIEEYCKSILIDNKIIVNKRPLNYMLLEYSNRPIFGLLKLIENTKRITNKEFLIANTKQDIIQQKGWLKSKNISLLLK